MFLWFKLAPLSLKLLIAASTVIPTIAGTLILSIPNVHHKTYPWILSNPAICANDPDPEICNFFRDRALIVRKISDGELTQKALQPFADRLFGGELTKYTADKNQWWIDEFETKEKWQEWVDGGSKPKQLSHGYTPVDWKKQEAKPLPPTPKPVVRPKVISETKSGHMTVRSISKSTVPFKLALNIDSDGEFTRTATREEVKALVSQGSPKLKAMRTWDYLGKMGIPGFGAW